MNLMKKHKDRHDISYLFCLVTIFILDNALLGGGKLLAYRGFSLRNLIALVLFVVQIPIVIKNRDLLRSNIFICWLITFLIVFTVGAIRGLLSGNSVQLIAYDVRMYAYITLLPIFMLVVNNKSRISIIFKSIFIISTLLSCFSLILQIIFVYFPEFASHIYNWNNVSMLGIITPGNKNVYRIFMKSMPYSYFAINYGIYHMLHEKRKRKALGYGFVVSINVAAIFLSFTRSIYLGMIFTVFLYLSSFYKVIIQKKLFLRVFTIVATSILIIMLLAVINNANYFEYAFTRISITNISLPEHQENVDTAPLPSDIFEDEIPMNDTVLSDSIRAVSISELVQGIKSKPTFGYGLGYRTESRIHQEFAYLDLTVKLGVIGCVLYILPLISMGMKLITNKTKQCNDCLELYTALAGTAVTHFFNPYLSNSIGISMYILMIAVYKYFDIMRSRVDRVH